MDQTVRIGSAAANTSSSAHDDQNLLELCVVVPVFNEAMNVQAVVRRVAAALKDRHWEIVFVDDDSPDGTAEEVRRLARADRRVRCLQRIGRRGLSSACVEGMLATAAPYVAVIDGDLQHDETLLPQMLETIECGKADIAIGSRYIAGGSTGTWDESRKAVSRFANRLARAALGVELTDPMSGFFLLRRELVGAAAPRLSSIGFKILLDIITALPDRPKLIELPYSFRERAAGESKLDPAIAWEFGMMLADKAIGRIVPARFLSFAAIGGFGVFVHFLVLSAGHLVAYIGFVISQVVATIAAMTFNFFINNILTYRDKRLYGRRIISGLLWFYIACGIGAVANVGVASYLFEGKTMWALSALGGILVGAVWNYIATGFYVWGRANR